MRQSKYCENYLGIFWGMLWQKRYIYLIYIPLNLKHAGQEILETTVLAHIHISQSIPVKKMYIYIYRITRLSVKWTKRIFESCFFFWIFVCFWSLAICVCSHGNKARFRLRLCWIDGLPNSQLFDSRNAVYCVDALFVRLFLLACSSFWPVFVKC